MAVVPEFNVKNSEFGKTFPAGGVNAGDPKMKQKKKHGKLIICSEQNLNKNN